MFIKNAGQVCFSFGGIGATPDDLTRQAMAEAHGLPLVRHPEAVSLIEGRFGEEAYPNRIKMAELPKDASLIPNDYNDIPGFTVSDIHCLPGFPEMAWPMLDWVLSNRYELPHDSERIFWSLVVPDVHESELVPVLEMLNEQFPDAAISSLPRFPHRGKRQVELGVRADAETIAAVQRTLKNTLKTYGVDV